MKPINIKNAMQACEAYNNSLRQKLHAERLCDMNPDVSWVKEDYIEALGKMEVDYIAFRDAANAALRSTIEAVQGRARVRLVSAEEIALALLRLERTLGITKKAMHGVSVTMDLNAQQFPGAYKGIPESTIFSAVYKSGSWRITDIRRDRTRAPSNAVTVEHTEESRKALLYRFTYLETTGIA